MAKKWAHFAFLIGASIALFGALIHWLAPFIGPDWYAFLHSPPSVVDSARTGTLLAPIGAAVIGLLMFICTLYGLAGAGSMPRLPLLKTGLTTIATICLLRGLLLIPALVLAADRLTMFDIVASLIWFIAGLGFFIGTAINWSALGKH